jgi:replicative DNA helicase
MIVPEDIPLDNDVPQLVRLGDLVAAFEADARKRHECFAGGRPFGPTPPLEPIAKEYGGAFPPGVHVVLGGAGTGKSAYALQTAASCGCPALYVSCEMSALELLRRHAARVTRTFIWRFKTGELAPDEAIEKVRTAAAQAPELGILDATQAYASPLEIERAAREVKGDAEHLLIVVDSLNAWAESAGDTGSEYESVSEACKALRTLAARMECPVMAVAERNRASFSKNAPKEKLGSGAGSRKIEYGAESVVSLETDHDALPPAQGDKLIRLTFEKNRNGAAGRFIELLFTGALQRYTLKE